MSTFCNTCLGEVCDFCKWYDFNGGEDGCYTGDGYCRYHKQPRDPEDGCPAFHCRNACPGNSFPTVQHEAPVPE